MPFQFQSLRIPEVKLITPIVFNDERGFFEETFKGSSFKEAGIDEIFPQDNHSFSVKGTIRGLHFQNPPFAQGKLVRCIEGRIFDVAVDIRLGSPTFSNWVAEELSSSNHRILWIPEGFAHGFFAMEDSHVEYKVTREYAAEAEDGIIWNDSRIAVKWPLSSPIVSLKDSKWGKLREDRCKFTYVGGPSK